MGLLPMFLAAQIGELQLRLQLAHHRLECEDIFRQQILVYFLHQPAASIAWRIGSPELHAFEQQQQLRCAHARSARDFTW